MKNLSIVLLAQSAKEDYFKEHKKFLALKKEINCKRKELGELFLAEGNTEKVLQLSQELDKLLNLYEQLKGGECDEL